MTRLAPFLLASLACLPLVGCGGGPPGGGGDAGNARDAGDNGGDASTPVSPIADRSEPAAYIRGAHPQLLIELDAFDGLGPRAGVGDTVIGVLDPLLDKPEGISIVRHQTIPMDRAQAEWTFEEVRALGEELFDGIGDEDTAVLHTMWLPGRYVSTSGGTILGVAWSNRHIAMFGDTIDSACATALPLVRERICREAEAAVWTHEIGHVIGLVNNGIPMAADHEDDEHPAHTTDRDDVMYFAYERASVADLLLARMGSGDGPLFEFGPASLADVAAFRAGGS